jgi:uncharacterized protein
MGEIRVEVCYARPDKVFLEALELPSGSTIDLAIERSGVLAYAPEIDPENCRVGIFGKLRPRDAVLRDHDRVEIYRPLIADPKEARRRRAAHKGASKAAP